MASGLCLASRNSATYGEPLYGIAPIPATELTQLIATPGNVQTAVINVEGSIKYTAYLWPYSVNPLTSFTNPTWANGCATNHACPPYWARYGHNIIYGGWGSDTIHGGPGDSAISGAEAPIYAYTDNFSPTCRFTQGTATGETCTPTFVTRTNTTAIRSDWYHPFNPGNVLGWTTPTTHNGPNPPNGKFKMFTGTDPRRKVMLTTTGALCKWGTGYPAATQTAAGCLPWIMDYTRADLTAEPLNRAWANGTYGPTPWSGTDLIFGDLGNDWIMGGQGRTQVFGGFGNDLIDLRATLTVNGGLNNAPVPNPLTGTYGTPGWEGLAFGGAGQDIFFAGTAGDRLIDWVGNHNTYYVPFSPFGMPTVSRTLQPFLPEFLYALSKSDGADPLLGLRYGGAATRNGEPFGELGLVLQHDAAWHTMMGPPFDKMPENLGGVGTDVPKTANTLPIGSTGIDTVSATTLVVAFVTGMGAGLPSGTDGTGAAAMPFVLRGPAGATVTYSFHLHHTQATGSGVIGKGGLFGATVDLATFKTGVITVTFVISSATATTTLHTYTTKNITPPPAPTLSATPRYVNNQNETTFVVTVKGQAGSIADIVITDSATPIPGVLNGMDVIGQSGVLAMSFPASLLAEGMLTVSVTLTDGSGNSAPTTWSVLKDTAAPPLSISAPPYVNLLNEANYQVLITGFKFASVVISATEGTTTVTDSGWLNGSQTWFTNHWTLSALADGPVTLTVRETDPYGNVVVKSVQVTKTTRRPGMPTVALTPGSDSGPSSTDYVTDVTTPAFLVTPGATAVATTVYVNGVPDTGQVLTTGTYTVTAVSFNVAGNPSYTAYAPKTLVVDTTPPQGTFTVKGTTLGGLTYTNDPTLGLSLAFSAAPAGLYEMAVSTDGGATFSTPVPYATTATVALPTATGLYTVAVRVTDLAGVSAVFSDQIELIRTTASISDSITAPTNTGAYDVGQLVTLAATATAADPVVSVTATLDGKAWALGTAIDTETLSAGDHTLVISATDAAGTVTTLTVVLAVHATIAGLTTAVEDGMAKGWIASTVGASLLTALSAAASALGAGDPTAAIADLETFVSDVAHANSWVAQT